MTVVEYDGRIVVVDVGLRFPTPEMVGHRPRAARLLLPARARARTSRRSSSRTATRTISARCRGCCASSASTAPPVYGGALTIGDGALEARRAQAARRRAERGRRRRRRSSSARSRSSSIHMTHSIPDSSAVALGTELGTVLITGDYKFDQTPVDGAPADVSRLAELGREGVLLLCGDSTNVDREGFSPSESVVGPHLEEVFARCEGRIVVTSFASNIHRVQQVVDAAARARPQGRAGRALDAQERRHRPHARPHRGPRGDARRAARDRRLPRRARRDHLDRLPGRAAVGAAPDGLPRPPSGRAAGAATPSSSRATPIPGNERAVNETIDRLYHIGCDVITPRDAPVHASGHGYAEEVKLMLNLVKPRYVMPFHGDFKRLRLHAQLAEAVGVDARGHLPGRERPAARDRRARRALRRRASSPG